MTRRYFGTDGIRGTVGAAPITPDFMLRLGHAVGGVLRRSASPARVLIGKDTRVSGYMIESALEAGLASAGVDVLLTGPLPTPGVAYLTRALRADLGIVISASHNAYPDNGIKFFSAQGTKLPDEWESAVEAALDEAPAWVASAELGRARRVDDAAGRYIEFCKATVPATFSLRGVKLVVDAAHGAAYQVAPAVFHELGAEVIRIGCEPNGRNINDGVGATSPAALAKAVVDHQADLGIALDGDADRLQIVDRQGRLFNGDELLYVLATDRLLAGQSVPGVVGTQMTNLGIEQALLSKGIALARAKVGDRYVLEELDQRGWVLGGEGSGHLLVLDRHSTGDGIVSALQVLAAMRRSQRELSHWLQEAVLFPQKMINVRLATRGPWLPSLAVQAALKEAESALGAQGRVLLRPSGTEPVVRVMVEARDSEMALRVCRRLADAVDQG